MRSHATASPVLAGSVPGVTVTVRSVEPPAGTDGGLAAPAPVGPPHRWIAVAVFRGFGAPVAKSAALTSVSTQPASARRSAVVLLGAGAGPLPSKQLAVAP